MSDLVLASREDHTLTLTINRPDARNALSFQTLLDFRALLAEARFDEGIRAVIITGAGDKSFCAGADLKERPSLSEAQVRQFVTNIRELMDDVESFPAPVIAAINGFCFGGGMELALGCDLRVAAPEAQLGLTECRLAIIPGAGGTQRLPRLVGLGKAKELILTGRRISADEALAIGLVNAVDADCLARARALAAEIGECGPVAVRQAKRAINAGSGVDLTTGLAIEAECYKVIIPTEDRLEALAAFREKRKPEFKGK